MTIEKLHEIANIENEYYTRCGDKWMSLEESVEMNKAYGEYAVVDMLMNKMLEREIRILHAMFS